MFKRTNRQPDSIVRGVPRLTRIATFGAFMAIVGLMYAAPALKISQNTLSNVLLAMGIGLVGFSFFLLVTHIVYLAGELEKTRARVRELEPDDV